MRKSFRGTLALMVGLSAVFPAAAEDIDLFVQPPGAAVGLPNVLIVLDNTANWSRNVAGQSIYINEKAALVSTLNNLSTDPVTGAARFRVGLMMFTETGNPNNNIDGGYVRAAIRDMNNTNKPIYSAMVNSLHENNDKSNGGKLGVTMAEAWRYFDGGDPRSGNNKQKTDYTGNVSGTTQSRAVYGIPDVVPNRNAIGSFAGSPYRSPIVPGSCGGNYIIYISNGAAQDNNADTTTATTLLTGAAAAENIQGATTTIPISPSGSQNNVGDEWARFMNQSRHQVVTYTVDVDPVTTGQGPGWTALLKSMAGVSNGKYFQVTSASGGASIAAALGRIFSEIQAVNSVFASVSLPVSVNTQGTFLNQVYVGMFRPDPDAYPRWAGNLKQYKLGVVNGQLRTLDADSEQAINPATGFITECARSFWTPTTTDTYWQFRPQGECLAVANSAASNYPDGNIVEKGAQAFRLRAASVGSRNMRTSIGGAALSDFSNSNGGITAAMLGAADATERTALINWARGADSLDENLNGNVTEMRPSVHGDVVHSRPVAINFGSDTSRRVVVFYGANDGALRAVNGNRTDLVNPTASFGGAAPGDELWSFMPQEFFGQIRRQRSNSPSIQFEGALPTVPAREPKPYGMDGPIAAYQPDSSTTWLYTAMRRGGRSIYAFDVSGIAPATGALTQPTLKWKRGCPNRTNDTDCSTGFSGIGQTWSKPEVFRTSHTVAGAPVHFLIMGGGYDACEDADPHSCTGSSKGNVVYVLNADTGALITSFLTDRAVTSDVFVVKDQATGYGRFAYVTDTGGNVYRISGASLGTIQPFGNLAPAGWTINKIASLGCDTFTTCGANRKFLFPPDVVEEPANSNNFYLLLGSGDREKPLQAFGSALGTNNYFFMLRDQPLNPTWLQNACGSGNDLICLSSLAAVPENGNPTDAELASAKGWKLDLRDGEQVVTSAITVFGTTTFSTHTPTDPVPGACTSNLGTARVYNVSFRNAGTVGSNTNRDAQISGGGLPPSPVAGRVTLDNGVTVPFIIGADAASPLEGSLPTAPATGTQPRAVTYWYIEK